jgi:hypothetical protein
MTESTMTSAFPNRWYQAGRNSRGCKVNQPHDRSGGSRDEARGEQPNRKGRPDERHRAPIDQIGHESADETDNRKGYQHGVDGVPANTRDRPWVGKIATHDLLAVPILPPSRMPNNGAAPFPFPVRASQRTVITVPSKLSDHSVQRDSAPGHGFQEQQRKRAAVVETHNCSELRDSAVTTHFDFRSLASLWATATCDGVMLAATKSREKVACAAPSAAAKSNHIYAVT